ncbi:methyl-accepting chemotaxis protein [Vibrio sp. Vb339]|uniref:methyl-accepting chemotaxis protein n=1 Tax=Vibrio sp. Vb339 TaxID=1192013 RepID=UPI0015554AA1|nr:methyl-accepting chemotaxis protein [Vibrio sp. Vb339]
MNKLGFKNTLLLSVSVLMVTCLLVSNYYSYILLKEQTVKSVNYQSSAAAKVEANKLEKWFGNKSESISALSKQYKPNQPEQDYVSLAEYTKDISKFSAVLISLDDGRSFSTISSSSWNNGVAIVDKYDARKRPWYAQGKKANGQLDITDVYKSASSGKNLVSIVKAIDNGVLLGDIELSILEKTVQSVNYPGAITVILDDNGNALASSSHALKVGMTFRDIKLPDVHSRMLAGEHEFDYTLDGIDKVAFIHDIPMVSGKKWYLFVGVDKSVAYKAADDALIDTAISSTIMLIIAVILCIAIMNKLYAPINALKAMVHDLALGNGDLTKRLPIVSEDDLGQISQGINTFIANLQTMMLQVSSSYKEISESVIELHTLTQNSSCILDEHRKETEQIVTALDEMSATSTDVAGNTSNAAQFTSQTSNQANASQYAMGSTISVVEQLVAEVETTSTSISNLGHDMTEITNVLTVIGEIADQTNLLALNAAIEAARAGEHGRGFAVVADEVRALAARTQTSTAEIEATLGKLKDGVSVAVDAMNRTKTSCLDTAQKSNGVATDLNSINESIQDINALNIQIAAAAEEQSSVADEITRNMAAIREMVEQLSTVGASTDVENEKLVNANNELNNIVSKFKLN